MDRAGHLCFFLTCRKEHAYQEAQQRRRRTHQQHTLCNLSKNYHIRGRLAKLSISVSLDPHHQSRIMAPCIAADGRSWIEQSHEEHYAPRRGTGLAGVSNASPDKEKRAYQQRGRHTKPSRGWRAVSTAAALGATPPSSWVVPSQLLCSGTLICTLREPPSFNSTDDRSNPLAA